MKKLKKSVKAIIIGAVAAVIAVSTVLAVVLLRKDDGSNNGGPSNPSTPPSANYQLTPAQLGLVNAINTKTDAENLAKSKEFQIYETSRFVKADGSVIDPNIVTYSGKNFIVTMEENNDEMFISDYWYYNSENRLISLTNVIYPDYSGYMLSVLDYSDNYVGYVEKPYAESFEDTKIVVYSVVDKNNPIKIAEHQSNWEDSLVSLDFRIYDFGYLTFFMCNDSGIEKVNIGLYDYSLESQNELFNIEMTRESYLMNKLEHTNNGFYYKDDNSIKMYSKHGVKSFEPQANYYYEYTILKFGILIKEFDSQYQNPTYAFLSYEDGLFHDINLDVGFYFDEIKAVDNKYFYVREKQDLSESVGRYLYFDCHGELVAKYDSMTNDDSIRYSDGKFVLLYNKIVAADQSITLGDYLVLNQENQDGVYNIFDSGIAVNKDYFAIFGENKNFYKFDGTAIFEEEFDQLYEYDGKYLGMKNNQFYTLDVDNNIATLIEGIDNELTHETYFNSKTLFDMGIIVRKVDNLYHFVDYDSQVKTVIVNNETIELKNIIEIEAQISSDSYHVLYIEFSNNEELNLTLYEKYQPVEEPIYSASSSSNAVSAYVSGQHYDDSRYCTKAELHLADYHTLTDKWTAQILIYYGSSFTWYLNERFVEHADDKWEIQSESYGVGVGAYYWHLHSLWTPLPLPFVKALA